MILTDYHIHTQYSWDSKLEIDDVIAKAISLNYDIIAITEHLDLLPWEVNAHGIFSLRQYSAHIDDLKAQHPRLRIIKGVEIGDYHLTKDYALAMLEDYPMEMILGAVHFLSDRTNIASPRLKPISKEQIIDYYKLHLQLVSTCEMDILAHLGVYKRHYQQPPDESFAMPIIKDILQVIIQKGIALEINFSPFRKAYACSIPENWMIDLYRDLGGNLFSIGGDCHHIDHFHDFRHLLPEWINDLELTTNNLLLLPD
ncbi:MAG: histidinol-phosphatase HisJ family protein [Candidatus Cloacimonetes bacterium]|nr:histidinol-phosphatase HisJ family protein [Candidatus Cloacimonadota bacterium]